MIEYLSKRKFIKALAHEASAHAQRTATMDRPQQGLRLEFVPPGRDTQVLTLVIRGNQVPQQWITLESGFTAGKKGYALANRGAFEIAFAAGEAASKKTGMKIIIGLPEMEYMPGWNGTRDDVKATLADAMPMPDYLAAVDRETT
jgi:hypothetical protein